MTTHAGHLNATKASQPHHAALWILQILVAVVFVRSGSAKLIDAPAMVSLFDMIGVGQWFRYFTGALEITGALLLIIPRASFFGAALLSGVMVGAVATHLFIVPSSPVLPLFLLAVCVFIAWGRRDQLRALVPAVASP
jgi:putative oxidoreductase